MSSQATATPNAASDSIPLAAVRSIARPLTLILATLTTGLISGFFYAYACSVTLGLALLPDEQYIEAMKAINATVCKGCSPSVSSVLLCRFSRRSRSTPRN